jgi:hypothetical protein
MALVEEAYRHGVETLCDEADALLATHAPSVAMEMWMAGFVGYVATKRGLAGTLKQAADRNEDLFSYVHGRLRGAMAKLAKAAVEAGEIRDDVDSADLLRGLGGVCMASDAAGWQEQALRLVALMMDGLRYGAPKPR